LGGTVKTVDTAVDGAVVDRLRAAIAAEHGEEEEQHLNGVLRMLGEKANAALLPRP
jgi:hypothetical protein